MLKIKDNVNLKELEKYPFECQDSASIFSHKKNHL